MCSSVNMFNNSLLIEGRRWWCVSRPHLKRSQLQQRSSLLVAQCLDMACTFLTSMLLLSRLESELEMILSERDWERGKGNNTNSNPWIQMEAYMFSLYVSPWLMTQFDTASKVSNKNGISSLVDLWEFSWII